jgi:FdhD protein
MSKKIKYLVAPNPLDKNLTKEINGFDESFNKTKTKVIIEKDLTIYLNNQEIVTLMTVGDHPEYLAVGYLLNQNMLKKTDKIKKIEYDTDLRVVVVRTSRKTNYEEKLKRKITTSGCAIGTVFGDVYDEILKSKIKSKKKIKHSWIYEISKKINLTPSLYLEAGAIHGCAIIENSNPIIYMEDVGRHNAVDKIAGYMFLEKINGSNKIFYTTGRLTSEMVIKTVKMKIPILISRSGFTSWGVELAKKTNLTLIGRAKGKKYLVLSGEKRIDHK